MFIDVEHVIGDVECMRALRLTHVRIRRRSGSSRKACKQTLKEKSYCKKMALLFLLLGVIVVFLLYVTL